MLLYSDFDEAYSTDICPQYKPQCQAPNCFIASYPPVTPPGKTGPFFVNTKFLQADRYAETVGPVPVRTEDMTCSFKR